jgi:Recombinase
MSTAYLRPPGRLGRPPVCPPEVMLRITALAEQGYSLREIAEVFNSEGIPTPAGRSRWYKSMVERTTKTLCARDVIAQAGG